MFLNTISFILTIVSLLGRGGGAAPAQAWRSEDDWNRFSPHFCGSQGSDLGLLPSEHLTTLLYVILITRKGGCIYYTRPVTSSGAPGGTLMPGSLILVCAGNTEESSKHCRPNDKWECCPARTRGRGTCCSNGCFCTGEKILIPCLD